MKTQTRRVVKPQPVDPFDGREVKGSSFPASLDLPCCPYGAPGDRLWVRETWAYNGQASSNFGPESRRREGFVTYAADGAKVTHYFDSGPMLPCPKQHLPVQRDGEADVDFGARKDTAYAAYFRSWRPSIHMPRWASRLTLELTGVRVERLNAISEEDAKAEGVAQASVAVGMTMGSGPCWSFVAGFRELWCGLNSNESWDSNPWVWVLEFKRLDAPAPLPEGKRERPILFSAPMVRAILGTP